MLGAKPYPSTTATTTVPTLTTSSLTSTANVNPITPINEWQAFYDLYYKKGEAVVVIQVANNVDNLFVVMGQKIAEGTKGIELMSLMHANLKMRLRMEV